jgi:PTS system fructose-specific IIC component
MSDGGVISGEAGCSLGDFTSPALIISRLRSRDAVGVIQELSVALQREACVRDLLGFFHAALNREFFGSTAMECGFAVPHARSRELDRLWFALGRSAEPIAWGAKGSVPVRLVFLIATPAGDATSYLNLVSALARLATQNPLISRLHEARSPAAMFSVISRVKLRLAASPVAA